jgi:hypothetical protein
LSFIRSFYKKQDKLISTFERAQRLYSNKDSDNEEEDDEEGEQNNKKDKEALKLKRKRISLYTKLSLGVNVVSINQYRNNLIIFLDILYDRRFQY